MITSDAQQPLPVRVKPYVCLRVGETFHDLSNLEIEIGLGCARIVRGSPSRALKTLKWIGRIRFCLEAAPD